METLKRIVQELRVRTHPPTEQEILNTAREYLQVLILKLIYQSKEGGALSFMGGTCLRICYDLKRYSEDLDFAFDDRNISYRFPHWIEKVEKELKLLGFDVAKNIQEEKVVQKAFIRFAGLPQALRLPRTRKEQKIHIKLEVDTRPLRLKREDRESFFVNRFQEIFPILKHTLPTLFAGKVLAVLHRPYVRGRDYYDLIWYLTRKTELNLDYLNRGAPGRPFKDMKEVIDALKEKIREVKPEVLLKDLSRFLDDPREADWISRYQELFDQLTKL